MDATPTTLPDDCALYLSRHAGGTSRVKRISPDASPACGASRGGCGLVSAARVGDRSRRRAADICLLTVPRTAPCGNMKRCERRLLQQTLLSTRNATWEGWPDALPSWIKNRTALACRYLSGMVSDLFLQLYGILRRAVSKRSPTASGSDAGALCRGCIPLSLAAPALRPFTARSSWTVPIPRLLLNVEQT